jgi:hypothetical protein
LEKLYVSFSSKTYTTVITTIILLFSVVQAELWDPPLLNPSFEAPILEYGQWVPDVNDWYEADSTAWIEYGTGEGNGAPLAIDGNQWGGSSSGYFYQQIGTYNGGTAYNISLVLGKKPFRSWIGVRVALWVGGSAESAADNVDLSSIGATMTDSVILTEGLDLLPSDVMATALGQALLSFGSGFTIGDPVWLEIKGAGGSQQFFDNVSFGPLHVASNPSPDNFEARIDPTTSLTWDPPDAISNPTYTLYFGTDPEDWDIEVTNLTSPSYSPAMDYMTTYSWRIDVVDGEQIYSGFLWSFTTGGIATDPQPEDGAGGLVPEVIYLGWVGDDFVDSYKAYFGTELPLPTTPIYDGSVRQCTANATTGEQQYYWRVDQYVNGVPTVEGDIWTFSTRGKLWYPPFGDLDGDRKIELGDLVLLTQQWLDEAGCIEYPDACADFVGEDGVDFEDFLVLSESWGQGENPVIINEIHYNPDLKYELVEFIELYNTSSEPVDISGWHFCDGIIYQFPPDTIIEKNGYVVVAENPYPSVTNKTVWDKYGIDESIVYWPFEGNLNNEGEKIELCDADGIEVDQVDYQLGFPWPTVGDAVPETSAGSGHSIQLINPTLDNDLAGSWRSAYPTPGAENGQVWAVNTPPHIRQVNHEPAQPRSGQEVTITAKVTDPDGVASVTLSYQPVNPGNYIPVTLPNLSYSEPTLPNPDYEANWTQIPMHDDGLNGDEFGGDAIYTVQLPGPLQTHRRLVRYRITVEDGDGISLQVPYSDDPQPNFAYFVYDGVPAWSGAVNPNGVYPDNVTVTYSEAVLRSLPVYHLIARETDVITCQYNSYWDDTQYHFCGSLIYDGKVYDNIHYRVRGQYSTFRWGKNKWKFDFNRGHYFQARDDYGRKRKEKWDKMNVGTGACPWWQYPHPGIWDQGAGGMLLNETLAFRLYNMAGVPACNTNYFQFRIIDGGTEVNPTNQYDGDFWGLYFTIENADGAFLNEHELPDGNTYRMDGGANKMNQGPTQTTGYSDVSYFISSITGYRAYQTLSQWENDCNLNRYYSSNAVGIACNDSDRRPEANCIYYHNPATNRWSMLPWDLDLMFEWATHYINWEDWDQVLSEQPAANIPYRNRCRELLDLLFNTDQIPQLVDEMSALISESEPEKSFINAEQAMWDYHPRVAATGHAGLWYEHNEFLISKDWPGMVDYYKTFLSPNPPSYFDDGTYAVKKLTSVAVDTSAPFKPTANYIGSGGYPTNDLRFQASTFSDPQGSQTFGAMKWRIAEIAPFTVEPLPDISGGSSTTITLLNQNENWKYFKGESEPSDPVEEWRQLWFNDNDWDEDPTVIGFSDDDDDTILTDMYLSYYTLYLRNTFDVSDKSQVQSLKLYVYVDDGCIIWINGTEVARPYVPEG